MFWLEAEMYSYQWYGGCLGIIMVTYFYWNLKSASFTSFVCDGVAISNKQYCALLVENVVGGFDCG